MSDYNALRPWKLVFNPDRERWERVTKELTELPIVIELSRDQAFRNRAHAWAWSTQGPTPIAQSPDKWPPRYGTALEAIGRYYYEIYRGFYANSPHLIEPFPDTFEGAKNQAKALSSANPFLRF